MTPGSVVDDVHRTRSRDRRDLPDSSNTTGESHNQVRDTRFEIYVILLLECAFWIGMILDTVSSSVAHEAPPCWVLYRPATVRGAANA